MFLLAFALMMCWQVGLAVVNGQLMAIGGFDGTTYLKTVEVYDPEQNCWKIYGGMNYRRLGGGVGVVKMPHPDGHVWQQHLVQAVLCTPYWYMDY